MVPHQIPTPIVLEMDFHGNMVFDPGARVAACAESYMTLDSRTNPFQERGNDAGPSKTPSDTPILGDGPMIQALENDVILKRKKKAPPWVVRFWVRPCTVDSFSISQ